MKFAALHMTVLRRNLKKERNHSHVTNKVPNQCVDLQFHLRKERRMNMWSRAVSKSPTRPTCIIKWLLIRCSSHWQKATVSTRMGAKWKKTTKKNSFKIMPELSNFGWCKNYTKQTKIITQLYIVRVAWLTHYPPISSYSEYCIHLSSLLQYTFG